MYLSAALITSLVALTSASEEVVVAGESIPGTVVNHLLPLCQRGGYEPRRVVPDKSCLTTPGLSLKVLSPARCANGTLAQVVVFGNRFCNYREPAEEHSFVDISQLRNKCLDTSGPGHQSMMFYCDGPQPKEHKPDTENEKDEESPAPLGPKKGSLSDNSCYVSGQRMRAPTFKHPEPDTCVNVPAHRQVKVYHTAVCANGQPAVFAQFSGYGCHGEPVETNVIEGKCMSLSKMDQFEGSVAFICDGVKQEQAKVVTDNHDNNDNNENKGSILGLVLILVFIVALALLSCAVACLRSVNFITKITSLFRAKEGQITLS